MTSVIPNSILTSKQAMALTKPTLLLVPGAYHLPLSYDTNKERLEALSYPVVTIRLPTASGISPSTSYKEDVEAIHSIILPLMDEGKEIVVVGHSYGGVPSYVSTEGQSIAERTAAGKKGGVRSAVFLCAFAHPEKDKFVTEVNQGSDTTWLSFREVRSFSPIFIPRIETDQRRMAFLSAMSGPRRCSTKTCRRKREIFG
jgi:pimeloyl-ACP methyl ester carboxylesterase